MTISHFYTESIWTYDTHFLTLILWISEYSGVHLRLFWSTGSVMDLDLHYRDFVVNDQEFLFNYTLGSSSRRCRRLGRWPPITGHSVICNQDRQINHSSMCPYPGGQFPVSHSEVPTFYTTSNLCRWTRCCTMMSRLCVPARNQHVMNYLQLLSVTLLLRGRTWLKWHVISIFMPLTLDDALPLMSVETFPRAMGGIRSALDDATRLT